MPSINRAVPTYSGPPLVVVVKCDAATYLPIRTAQRVNQRTPYPARSRNPVQLNENSTARRGEPRDTRGTHGRTQKTDPDSGMYNIEKFDVLGFFRRPDRTSQLVPVPSRRRPSGGLELPPGEGRFLGPDTDLEDPPFPYTVYSITALKDETHEG